MLGINEDLYSPLYDLFDKKCILFSLNDGL